MDVSPIDAPQWPASPELLADPHLCPVCFQDVRPPACPSCGFVFTDRRAGRVLDLGRQVAQIEAERRRTIESILVSGREAARRAEALAAAERAAERRTAQDAAARAQLVTSRRPAPSSPSPGGRSVTPPALSPRSKAGAEDLPDWPPPAVPADDARAPRGPRRRLSVPVLLLIVGVSLVGVAAVFFLLVAWFVAGIAVRALIIAGITFAAMGAASWLRRRSLTATAEGTAVLGVVLLALDAWAVRANDLFGAGAAEAAVFVGASALVVGAVCRAWAVVSTLRAPDLAAAVALPVGVGVLVSGLLDAAPAESVVAGLLGASAAGLAHALPVPWSSARPGADAVPERVALAVIGVVALLAAAVTTGLAMVGEAAIVWSAILSVALGAAHAVLARPTASTDLPGSRAFAGVASSVAVAAAGTFAWQLALRTGDPVFAVLVAPVLAVAVAVVVDRLRVRGGLAAAGITAAVVGGVSLAAVLVRSWVEAGQVITGSWVPWRTGAFTLPATSAELPYLGLVTATAIAALLFAAPTLGRPVVVQIRPVVAVLLIVSAAARSGVPAVAVGVAVAATALCVVVLSRSQARAGWLAAGAVAAASGFVLATAAPWLWFAAAGVAMAAPIADRLVLRARDEAGAALAVASMVVATLASIVAPAPLAVLVGVPTVAGEILLGSALALVQWVALAALAAALLLPLDRLSRAAVTVGAELVVALTLVATVLLESGARFAGQESDALLRAALGEPILGLVRGCLLVAGLVAVVFSRRRSALPATAAAGLVAPMLAATTHAGLDVAGASDAAWAPLVPLTAAVVVVVLSAWGSLAGRLGEASRPLRRAADFGAAATAAVVTLSIPPAWAWAAAALAALGFAGVAATRGWAGVRATPEDDVFSTRAAGAPLAEAPRRLFVWPAAVTATLAWWSWLGAGTPDAAFPVETGAVPVGVALVALGGALVYVRRRTEASVAVGAGLAIGLGGPALQSLQGDGWRGPVVAAVAAAVCLALSFAPLRRVRPTAPVGAAVALLWLALIAVDRAAGGGGWDAAWLLLLVAVALGSAVGHAGTVPRRAASRLYAELAPPLAMIAGAATVGLTADSAAVVWIALTVFAVVHIGAALVGRTPLGAGSRWAALAGAALAALASLGLGVLPEVEAATLPVGGMILAGAVTAAVRGRRRGGEWPITESRVWIAGLVVATVPSLLAPVDPVRVWLFLAAALAGAAAASIAPVPGRWRLRVPSALVLAGAAVAMGARALADPLLASADAAAATAGAGAVAIAVVLASTAAADRTARHPIALAGAGAALLDTVVLLRFDGALPAAVIAAVAGGAVTIVGASTLGLPRWRGVGGILAVGGLALVWAVCGIRFWVVATQPGAEPDLWALAAGGITVAAARAAVRAAPSRRMDLGAGAVLAATTAGFALAETTLLVTQDAFVDARAVLAMSVLSAAAVVGLLLRARLGWSPAIAAMVSAAGFGLVAIFAFGVTPVELVTAPPAAAGLAYGAWSLRRHSGARSWPLLGPWIVLLTVPSLLHDAGGSELWRVVALGVTALGLVVAGAVLRLQAPLVLGSAVLLIHAAAQLWPWISAVYIAVPWWLWLGIGGAVLIFLAATYERRVRQMRAAFVSVASLR
ncbi:hypothetical protein [Microbacterium sp. BK668]|uniref:SCO7613 C-terminal domain-containing membrane protein n=1 Tax=Microbacterium sp. BK668 TaxID=2512118 RepID=UPI00105F7314|nr:hypothetical protein [Microbacterium sp. BK668]TDN91116.1 hypothetical protein EV279_0614 [Microbacterium sp. BK668]